MERTQQKHLDTSSREKRDFVKISETHSYKNKSNNQDPKKMKAKQTYIYLVIHSTPIQADKMDLLLRKRLRNPPDFEVTEIASLASGNETTTMVTLRVSSSNKASRLTDMLNKSNRDNTVKIHCYSNKTDITGESIGPTPGARTEMINILKELVESGNIVLKNHNKKIDLQTETIKAYALKETELSGDDREKCQFEIAALNDKLKELTLQKEEFILSMQSIRSKLRTTIDNPKSERAIHELRKQFGIECHRLEAALPMYARRKDIVRTIRENQVSVILGETGSGKSTQMVQYLHQAGFVDNGLIACTQPRKIAAVSLATHVSKELASSVGQTVGYHVGMQSKRTGVTKVVFMTDHILLNECLSDRTLSRYACIIIDEAHERSIHTDLLIGLLRDCLESRPDLRVVITSATINPDIFVEYFGGENVCPVLRVSGRTFPVDVIWDQDDPNGGEYTDSYEARALQKAIEIHTKTEIGAGDILVFLTSGNETENCVGKFQRQVNDNNYVCLQLHGRLKPDEQQLVFNPTPKGKRKIVFATNSAETSITIDGIKFVIDTGVVKEMRFDPKRNMSSLDVVSVSQSSANQRAGRAGRTSSGACHRLYCETDFNSMEKCSSPEILRIQVSQAMLKLLELGVDPLAFKYVQSPLPSAMKLAMDELKSTGVVDSEGLTEVGKFAARLPVEPRLGVMIKNGIDLGISAEALVLASCCNQSNIFFRVGTPEEKKKADLKKMKFCHEGGDLMTMLSVYRTRTDVPEKAKGSWCKENNINGKAMKGMREMMKEIHTTLQKEFNLKVKHEFGDPHTTDAVAQKLLFDCMKCNLSYYLGHVHVGYLIVDRSQRVQLHPSSALLSLGLQPKWVVFNKVLKTSADFITEVTPVSPDLLNEALAKHDVDVDESALEKMCVGQIKVFPIGRTIFFKFVGKMHRNRKSKEEEIRIACDNTPVIVEANKPRGEITLYSEPQYGEVASRMIQDCLSGLSNELLFECREEPIGNQKSGVRALLGKGGLVEDIMLPGDFRTMSIKQKPLEKTSLDETDLHDTLSQYGKIESIWKHKKGIMWGKVTYIGKLDAMTAHQKVNADANMAFTLSPVTFGANTETTHQTLTMKLTWCRRPAKGVCFITLENPEDQHQLVNHRITINGQIVTIKLAKQTTPNSAAQNTQHRRPADLFIGGLGSTVTENSVRVALESMVTTNQGNVKDRFRINIPRENLTWSTDEVCQTKEELKKILSPYTPPGTFEISLREYKQTTVNCVAYLTVFNTDACENIRKYIQMGDCTVGGKLVTADMEYKTSIFVPKRLFDVVHDELDNYLRNNKDDGVTTASLRTIKSGSYAIDIKSNNLQAIAKAKVRLEDITEGDTFGLAEVEQLHLLICKESQNHIRTIERSTATLISTDWRQTAIRIHGSKENKQLALMSVRTEIGKLAAVKRKDVNLKSEENPPGLLKALTVKYGVQFDKLKSLTGLANIGLNLRNHVITLSGDDDTTEKAMDLIAAVRAELVQRHGLCTPDLELPSCPICFCPIEESEMSWLEYCGHAYCTPCLTTQLQIAVADQTFPIVCATDNCGKEFVLKDFGKHIASGEINQESLVDGAINNFVQKMNGQYRYCLTPDCKMVYKVSDGGEKFICSICKVSICTQCQVKYHENLTCDVYQSTKNDSKLTEYMKIWVEDNPDTRKICPVCKMGIEKDGGCNRMTCRCGANLCWVCLQVFPSADDVYMHLPKCER